MSDLIWVGNTLYPRWVVFVVPLAATLVSFATGWLLSWSIRRLWAFVRAQSEDARKKGE